MDWNAIKWNNWIFRSEQAETVKSWVCKSKTSVIKQIRYVATLASKQTGKILLIFLHVNAELLIISAWQFFNNYLTNQVFVELLILSSTNYVIFTLLLLLQSKNNLETKGILSTGKNFCTSSTKSKILISVKNNTEHSMLVCRF